MEEAGEETNRKEELRLNILDGLEEFSPMRTRARILKYEVSLLIDGGASHNFIDINVVSALGLYREGIKPLKVETTWSAEG